MALRVIGAGFGRTGTMSLKLALERLGFGPCYHMEEIVRAPARIDHWMRAAQAEKPDWDAVFSGYAATVDWPAATYWRDLAAHYPDARVILSERDPARWFESTQNTIFNPALTAQLPPSFRAMVDLTVHSIFDGQVNDQVRCIAEFERHSRSVLEALPASRVLRYQPGDGWEPLCAFLGVAVPDDPYPRTNDAEEFRALAADAVAMQVGGSAG